ncbi:GDYXXLXY domain-containing protein [Neolewinella antarctica]|uniref:Membrane-anchored protein n=1 Tax=Neolewinella antarctica TaxID=442734 RepID=A0ABX0X6K9_9BACT|nr:GDYXXLXY domain-containing protein [Neolewinella antarctica]NJC24850.1 putative membrane-anchored protein [Neolewinella antarctica]
MKPLTKLLIVGNLLAMLIYVAYSVQKSERLLDEGKLVLLRLAPADPRSLLQGDYMRLDYAITREVDRATDPKRGFLIVSVDGDGLGRLERVQQHNVPLAAREFPIRYLKKDWSVDIGADSYFFQEGRAEDYGAARYGGLVLDKAGNSLLQGLYSEDFVRIE